MSTENNLSEELFQAIDTIIAKRLENFAKDKIILTKIIDDSQASVGEYVVTTDNNLNFTVYSDRIDLCNDIQAYVYIPDGDYTKRKIILSLYEPLDIQLSKLLINPIKITYTSETLVDNAYETLFKYKNQLLSLGEYLQTKYPNEWDTLGQDSVMYDLEIKISGIKEIKQLLFDHFMNNSYQADIIAIIEQYETNQITLEEKDNLLDIFYKEHEDLYTSRLQKDALEEEGYYRYKLENFESYILYKYSEVKNIDDERIYQWNNLILFDNDGTITNYEYIYELISSSEQEYEYLIQKQRTNQETITLLLQITTDFKDLINEYIIALNQYKNIYKYSKYRDAYENFSITFDEKNNIISDSSATSLVGAIPKVMHPNQFEQIIILFANEYYDLISNYNIALQKYNQIVANGTTLDAQSQSDMNQLIESYQQRYDNGEISLTEFIDLINKLEIKSSLPEESALSHSCGPYVINTLDNETTNYIQKMYSLGADYYVAASEEEKQNIITTINNFNSQFDKILTDNKVESPASFRQKICKQYNLIILDQ